MKNFFKHSLSLLFVALLIVSCSDNGTNPTKLDDSLFPFNEGNSWTYRYYYNTNFNDDGDVISCDSTSVSAFLEKDIHINNQYHLYYSSTSTTQINDLMSYSVFFIDNNTVYLTDSKYGISHNYLWHKLSTKDNNLVKIGGDIYSFHYIPISNPSDYYFNPDYVFYNVTVKENVGITKIEESYTYRDAFSGEKKVKLLKIFELIDYSLK